ncbi:hypothetical protein [Roseomonas marmotae]|uniref:Uncharacterized protein n=1 Tax=Roseomonas marmotae TaxID=2768161 RepID=A0ABS3KFC5_9PROT|nr:hypothetical protein [Roseomonas marmotae]MBO1076166.1 hypothetical protein [Roseomonas marmotae]QTI81797.1 hypothetical protein IAI58_20795 [Roseomonas marmotae]
MAWWQSSDGLGHIGDRPADILGTALTEALGESFDLDLLAGFLSSLGSALLLDPEALVLEGHAIARREMEILTAEIPPIVVPISTDMPGGMLEERLFDSLEAMAFSYRDSGVDRLPRLAEVLETLSFVARGRLREPGSGTELTLRGIRLLPPGGGAAPTRWALLRGMLLDQPDEMLVAGALADADWRLRMLGLMALGRFRLRAQGRRALKVPVPGTEAGLRDEDHRALLALRDIAAERAGLGDPRPVHSDPEVAAARAALRRDIEAMLDGVGRPRAESPAFILTVLADPASVAGQGPGLWRRWLES